MNSDKKIGKISDEISNKISDKSSDKISDRIIDNITDYINDKISDNLIDSITEKMTDKNIDKLTDFIIDNITITITDKSSDKITDKISEKITDSLTDKTSDKLSNKIIDYITDKRSDKSSNKINDKISDYITDNITDKISDKISDEISDKITDKITDKISDKSIDNISDKIWDRIGDKITNNISDNIIDKSNDEITDKSSNKINDKITDKITNTVTNNSDKMKDKTTERKESDKLIDINGDDKLINSNENDNLTDTNRNDNNENNKFRSDKNGNDKNIASQSKSDFNQNEIEDEITKSQNEQNEEYDNSIEKIEKEENNESEKEKKEESEYNKNNNQPLDTDESFFYEITDIPTEYIQKNDTIDKENNKTNRANIHISFRQLSEFRNERKAITFNLFGLVTKTFEAKTQIYILVNLIKITGEIEISLTNISCILEKTVKVNKGDSAQADFKCILNDLEEEYYSLRFYNSNFISGIPNDEILLNPELTKDAIMSGEIYNYSISQNKNEYKIPPTFTSQNIKENNAHDELIIEGTLNKEVNNKLKFLLRLAYPEGASMLCSLTSFKAGPSSIICKVDRDIYSGLVIIEQTIFRYENEEFLVLTGISEKNITCKNGLLREAEEKIKCGITFRQITNFEPNGSDEFSFILETILSQEYKENYSFILSIIILIGNNRIEKDSICTFIESTIGKIFIRGYFKCVTKVNNEEYIKINFKKAKSIIISPYNTNITGVFGQDKNKLSPSLEIAPDNIKISEPISFQPKELVKIEDCREKGKFKIIGTFDGKFKEKTFEFPLSYPSVNVKCKVEESEAGKEVEVICKLQSELRDVKSLIIEPRIIIKRNKEILFMNQNIFQNISMSCENYNKIKFNKAIRNQRAYFTFLTISKINPSGNSESFINFVIGMERNPNEKFTEINIPINTKYSINSEKQLKESEISINCSIATQKEDIAFL